MSLAIPTAIFEETIALLRCCGGGRRECQVFWTGPWENPKVVSAVVHPQHTATAASVIVDDKWINEFWVQLADQGCGLRAQVHSHPGAAFHSATDDAFPILSEEGFLSLVIPRFAQGPMPLEGAFLARMNAEGRWREAEIAEYLEFV